MSNYAAAAAQAGDKYLESLAQGQARIIEYVQASKDMMPQMPEAPVSKAVPSLPSLQDISNLQFGFASKMLEQQQRFFRRLYAVSGPTSGKKPAAKRTASSRSGTSKATKKKAKATPRRNRSSS